MASVQVISLGGSIIAPDKVDVSFLPAFRKAVLEYLEQDPERRLILVCGGGGPAREYQGAYRAVLSGPAEAEAEAQDWLGIAATRLNAGGGRFLFQTHCPQPGVRDP